MPKKFNSRQIGVKRLVIAAWLRNDGASFAGIGQVMRCTKEEARRMVAKALRRGLMEGGL